MIGALVLVHLPHGDAFVGKPGAPSGEPALIYLACAFPVRTRRGGRVFTRWADVWRRASQRGSERPAPGGVGGRGQPVADVAIAATGY